MALSRVFPVASPHDCLSEVVLTVPSRNFSWVGWLAAGCSIAAGVLAVPQCVSDLRAVLHTPEAPGFDEPLSRVQPGQVPWLIGQQGGRWGQYGWYLASGTEGRLRIKLPAVKPGVLRLRLWAYDPGYLSVTVAAGGVLHDVPVAHLDGRPLEIAVNGASELLLVASNEFGDQLVLDRLAAAWFQTDDRLPALWPVAAVMTIGLAGWGWAIHRQGSPRAWMNWIGCTGILLLTAAGFAQRWNLFEIARGLPVDPDVVGYTAYAHSLGWFTSDHGFYSGTFQEREPMHVAALNLWFRFWGETFPAARWYTVCLSTLLVLAVGLFTWRLSGHWLLGTFAGGLMAFNPVIIEESVRGLRLESLTLLFVIVLSIWVWARGWIGAILLGGMTGLMALGQSPALAIVLPLIWLGWLVNVWRERREAGPLTPHRWRWPQLVLTSLLAVTIFLPHLYGLYRVHGDPAWPSHTYARWLANFEFPDRIGTAGFPAADEYASNAYAGPPITYGQYLFQLHSIPRLIRGQITGWIKSTVYMSASLTPHLNETIFLFHLGGFGAMARHVTPWMTVVFALSLALTALGWVDLWRHPRYWWVPFLSLWGTWYVAYLYSVRSIELFRHTGHVYPLLLFCLLWGGYGLYNRCRRAPNIRAC